MTATAKEKPKTRKKQSKAERGQKQRAASAKAQRAATYDAQNIGPPPTGKANKARKAKAVESLQAFIDAYSSPFYEIELSNKFFSIKSA